MKVCIFQSSRGKIFPTQPRDKDGEGAAVVMSHGGCRAPGGVHHPGYDRDDEIIRA